MIPSLQRWGDIQWRAKFMKKMLRNQEKLDTKGDEASGPASTYFEIVQQLVR